MSIFDNRHEYIHTDETQDLSKFDIFIAWFWLILGLGSLLIGVIFSVLKLFRILSWAWWIILSPIWGFIGLVALITCFIVIGVWINELVDGIRRHKKHRKEKDQK